jgi:hypothetical protein
MEQFSQPQGAIDSGNCWLQKSAIARKQQIGFKRNGATLSEQ